MDKNDLKECLTNIYYLPFLISNNYMTENNYNGSAQNESKKEADKANLLLENIWIYLNPEKN